MKSIPMLLIIALLGCSKSEPEKTEVKSEYLERKVHGRDISHEIPSPSGERILKVGNRIEEYPDGWSGNLATFRVLDKEGNEIYICPYDYATWFSLSARWVSETEIEIKSSDVGDARIFVQDGAWRHSSDIEHGVILKGSLEELFENSKGEPDGGINSESLRSSP